MTRLFRLRTCEVRSFFIEKSAVSVGFPRGVSCKSQNFYKLFTIALRAYQKYIA